LQALTYRFAWSNKKSFCKQVPLFNTRFEYFSSLSFPLPIEGAHDRMFFDMSSYRPTLLPAIFIFVSLIIFSLTVGISSATDIPSNELEEAEELARSIEPIDLREYVLHEMALGYAVNDAMEQAERIAQGLSSGEWARDDVFRVLAAWQAENHNISEALRLRSYIGSQPTSTWVIGVIVNNQAKSEGVAAALQTALSFPEGPDRARALLGLAWAQIHAKDFSGALQTVQIIPIVTMEGFDLSKEPLLSILIDHQLSHGSYEDARRTADLYPEADGRAAAHRKVRMAQLQQGEIADVFASLSSVEDPTLKDGVLLSLAVRYAQQGDLDSATKMINEISSRRHQRIALTEMFAAMAEAGFVTQALEGTSRIDSPGGRAEAVRRILLIGEKRLDGEEFFRLLAEQEPILRAWKGQPYDMLLSEIAQRRFEHKDVDGAIKAIGDIADEKTRNIAHVKLAREQAKAGDLVESRLTLGRMTRSAELVFGIQDIVIEHAKRGQYGEARNLVSRQVGDNTSTLMERADQYKSIAYWQAKSGHSANALSWARVLPTPIEKALAIFGAGLGQLALMAISSEIRAR
jgi:hypothetical protein